MRRLDEIAAALAAHASRLEERGAGRFQAVLQNGTALTASAVVDDGWLVLDAPHSGELPDLHIAGAGERLWTLLGVQGGLAPAARLVLRAGGGAVRLGLRAEIALDAEVDVGRRVREACAALQPGGTIASNAAPPTPEAPHANVVTWLRATGWPLIERSGGRLAVELEVPGTFRQALVEMRPDGCVCLALPLAADEEDAAVPSTSVCRAALGLLLLRASSVLRLVRPTGDVAAARFEVVLGEAPVVAELRHALAALSTAARFTLREAAVLRADADVAAAYLDLTTHIVPPAHAPAEPMSQGG